MPQISSLCLTASCGLLTVTGALENVNVEVDTASPAESISPGLFGHNLEFTRHDLFAGLSAQLIANRQFVLTPKGTKWPFAWDNDRSFPPRWSPVGDASFAQPGYAGNHSSAIHCIVADGGQACGIKQGKVAEGFNSGMGAGSAIPLQAGTTYAARLTVRASADKEMPVSFAVGAMPDLAPVPGSDGYTLTVAPDASSTGFMCADADQIKLPCGNCGPNWGDLSDCKSLCSAQEGCTNITYFANGGCRAYKSCENQVPVPSSWGTQGSVYEKAAPNGYTCEQTARLKLPCGNCGPDWGSLEQCQALCAETPGCSHFAFFDDRGCQAFSSCEAPEQVPSSWGCHGSIFQRSDLRKPSIHTTFSVPSDGEWHTLEVNITAEYGVDEAMLTVSGQDAGEFWIGAVSLMPADNFLGLRRDVIALLKEIGFGGTLRFPGGCFAPFYNWRDQLLPPDARPPMLTPPGYCAAVSGGVDAYTDGAVENGMSTDEYMALLQELGMQPSLTLALQFGTDEEIENARAWAEYTNGASDTPMGALRASRGNQEPFNVRHWYLGNEINLQTRYHNYPDDIRSVHKATAEEYAPIAAAAAKAVLTSPPDGPLHLFFVGSGNKDWDVPVYSGLPVGPHYSTSNHGGYVEQKLDKLDDYTKAAEAGGTVLLQNIQNMRKELNMTVSISTDEWGYGSPWLVNKFGVGHAMYAAALVGSVVRNAVEFNVEFSNYFEVINEGGINVKPFSAELDPIGELFVRYAQHQHRFRLPVTSGEFDVDVLASLGKRDALITIANLDAAQGRTVALSVAGAVDQSVSAEVLAAEKFEPDGAFIKSTVELPVKAGALTLSLPPYAVAHVRVPLGTALLV